MKLSYLGLAFAVTITGCAANIDAKKLHQIDFTVPVEVNSVTLVVSDKRVDENALKDEIPTPWGRGQRVSDESFKQSPLSTFALVLGNKLGQQKYSGAQSMVVILQFDIALTKTPARRVYVNESPGAQAYLTQNGPAGAGTGLVAQGLIKLIENSRSPSILSLQSKIDFGGRMIECNGSASIEDGKVALAWAEVVHSATGQCGYELAKENNSVTR